MTKSKPAPLIEETLRKIAAAATPTGKPLTEPSADRLPSLPGAADCPLCGGMGYLRQDLPLGHPEFGKLQICSCRSTDVSQQVYRRLFSLSRLHELHHLTFEQFQPRGRIGMRPAQADSLQVAYNQARQFAQTAKGWLLLQGGYGCGKTHLAAAIGNFAVGMGVPTLFLTVPDLLDTLRFAYDDPEATFEQRFEEIRSAPLLIMDDFGTQNATAWAQEKLFQIINYRYVNRLPLVVTTNLMLDQIEGRIRSRLDDPDLVTRVAIRAPDFRNPTSEIGRKDLSSLELLHKFTFANFDLRRSEDLEVQEVASLEKAFNAAAEFARQPQGWLVFIGDYGCGKTHLAAAIANYRADLGILPLFVNLPDLMSHLRATFSAGSPVTLDQRFEEVRTAPVLILDDLGSESSSPWVSEKLYQLFNYRYLAELPTVVTTANVEEKMDKRIYSRMQDSRLCRIIAITVPSYRGGTAQSKAAPRKKRTT